MRCCTAAPVRVLGPNLAAVVPAQAGTHNHPRFRFSLALPHRVCCGLWVPACAGTTAESHCFTSLRHLVADLADAFDPDLHHVAGLEVLAPAGADAGGCAGEDQVARMEREPRGEVRDLL